MSFKSIISATLLLLMGSAIYAQQQDTTKTKMLKEVLVEGIKSKQFIDSVSSLATRLDIKLIETPQSVQIITKDIMKEQQSLGFNELLKNAAGVSNSTPYADYSIRGFTSYNTMLYNGLNGQFFPDNIQAPLFNIEQVQILRGPAAILYGTSNPGGLVNMITKKPLDHQRFEANIIYGSWNEKALQLDQTNAITKDKKLSYRMLVNFMDKGSFRGFKKSQQVFITPSLAYKFNNKTSLSFEYNYFHVNSNGSSFDDETLVPTKTDGSWDWKNMPLDFSVQSPNDKTIDYGHSFDLAFNHQFNKSIKLTFLNRYVSQNQLDKTHYFNKSEPAYTNDTINRSFQLYDFRTTQFQSSLFNSFKLKTGKVNHIILVSVDYANSQTPYYTNKVVDAASLNIKNPDYSNDDINQYTNFTIITDNYSKSFSSVAGYVQEYMEIGEKLKINAGIRFDKYILKSKQNYVDYSVDSTVSTYKDTISSQAWVPKIGILYNLNRNMAIYANYTESFEPQSVNSPVNGGPFPPLTGKTFEAGFKADLLKQRLSVTIAAYSIDYKNYLIPSDSTFLRYKAIDGYNSKGIELTAQGNVSSSLSILLNYSYNNVSYFSTTDSWSKDDKQVNVPKHIAGLFLSYAPVKGKLKNLGLNIGIHYESDRVAAWGNQLYIAPSFSVLDAGLNYKLNNFKLYINLNNIMNTRYAIGGTNSGLAYAGAPRNFRIGLNYTFDKRNK